MVDGAMEDEDQHVYGALEENNTETKKTETNNLKECWVAEAKKLI